MSEELHPSETVTTIYLIRHGHTEPVEDGKLYNDPAVELTEKGVEQAQALGKFLKTLEPDLLISSSAKRVVSTAALIEKETSLKNILQEDLNEWSVGDWEGRTYLQIKKEDPEDYKNWTTDPIKNAPPNGESIEDLCSRVSNKLQELIHTYEGKSIALVTHAGVARAILIEALEMPVRNFWRLNIPVGSISRIDFSKNFATVHYFSRLPDNPISMS